MTTFNLDLDDLDTPNAYVKTASGARYPVRPLSRRLAEMIDTTVAAPEGAAKVEGFYNVVAALLPDMPRGEVDDLNVAQVAAIIELAKNATAEAAGTDGTRSQTPAKLPSRRNPKRAAKPEPSDA